MDNSRYLFRGKRLCGTWREGQLYRLTNGNVYVLPMNHNGDILLDSMRVDPATIGQWTGLKDKNGKPVFEGDVMKRDRDPSIYTVIWDESGGRFLGIGKSYNEKHNAERYLLYISDELPKYGEIIGNIHDNPDLLEVNI